MEARRLEKGGEWRKPAGGTYREANWLPNMILGGQRSIRRSLQEETGEIGVHLDW